MATYIKCKHFEFSHLFTLKQEMKCLIHTVLKEPGKEVKISDQNWNTVVNCARKWIVLDGDRRELAEQYKDVLEGNKDDAAKLYCFHTKCYSRFTDKGQIERAEKRKRKLEESAPSVQPSQTPCTPSPKKRLRSHRPSALTKSGGSRVLPKVCVICNKKVAWVKVRGRRVMDSLLQTATTDAGVLRQAAEKKQDESVLRHIRGQDCFAIEVHYHTNCYRKYTRFLYQKAPEVSQVEHGFYRKTFDRFCEDVIQIRIIDGYEVLRMSKLLDMFVKMARGVDNIDASSYRSEKLKKRLQLQFPQLIFHQPAKQYRSELVFVEDVRHVEKIQSSSEATDSTGTETTDSSETASPRKTRHDDNTVHVLYNAALKLKSDLNVTKGYEGDWPPLPSDYNLNACQQMIPVTLYNTFAWIIGASEDPTIEDYVKVDDVTNIKLLSILQDIIVLQSKGRKHTLKSLSLGLTIRHIAGSKKIIDLLNAFGHSSSHKTIVRYDTTLAQIQLNKGPVFVPDSFSEKSNTVLVWDNIDFSEQTTSGHGTTHHTNGIAIQCSPGNVSEVLERQSMPRIPKPLSKISTQLQPYQPTRREGPPLIDIGKDVLEKCFYVPSHHVQHLKDLAFVIMRFIGAADTDLPGWSGFNTLCCPTESLLKSNIAYLPVIEASPTEMNTVSTILCRSLEMADKLQLQTITVVFDLTIYAKAQEIRWMNDDFRKRLIVRLGEFHTCMSFLSIIGKRFQDADLKDILIEAEIVAGGSINAVMEGKHYNRCMYVHKLMFEALHRLKFKCFMESLSTDHKEKMSRFLSYMSSTFPSETYLLLLNSEEFLEIMNLYENFDKAQSSNNKTHALWNSYLDMVEVLLSFVRATRESDWKLHLASIRSMLPWYFAYDKTHYSRYLPVYWMEMISIENTHPEACDMLTRPGQWTVQRQTSYGFSAVACDQTIEQTINRESKTSGGITGITLNRNAVRRWILSQSQRTAIHHECEILAGLAGTSRQRKDLDTLRNKRDEDSIGRIMECIEQMINPFTYDQPEMISISSGVVADDEVSADLLKAEAVGEVSLMNFIEERLASDKKKFHDPIKQTKSKTFSNQSKIKAKTKSGKEIILQSDRKLFSRLLIISQQRSVDLKEVLKYSLGPVSYPLASSNGSISKTNKSVLLHLIESTCKDHLEVGFPKNAVLIYDGMAVIQSLPKQLPSTFGELADFILTILLQQANQHNILRIDFVTDRYPEISIKNEERNRRAFKGSQQRQIYSKDQKIPQQWSSFLAVGKNKESLVEFLYSIWTAIDPAILGDVNLYIAHGADCHKIFVNNGVTETAKIYELCCDHEEADTRMILHAKHASEENYSNVIVKSPDTDVALIMLHHVEDILSNLYFFTGSKSKSRMLNLSTIFNTIGRSVALALIGLHTFTGCDSTSSFHGKGKKKPFNLIQNNIVYQSVFKKLGNEFTVDKDSFAILEQFVCDMYGQRCSSVDDARYRMFCLKTSSEQSLPPTSDALTLHVQRSNYQAAIHKRSLLQNMCLPSPKDHGWRVEDGKISIIWMSLDPAPANILKYVHCNCSGKCDTKRCSCKVSDVSCTDLCGCTGCDNTVSTSSELLDIDEDSDIDGSDDDS